MVLDATGDRPGHAALKMKQVREGARLWPQVRRSARPSRGGRGEGTAQGFAYAVPATLTGIVGYGRGERI
jgi:hypothetical protein